MGVGSGSGRVRGVGSGEREVGGSGGAATGVTGTGGREGHGNGWRGTTGGHGNGWRGDRSVTGRVARGPGDGRGYSARRSGRRTWCSTFERTRTGPDLATFSTVRTARRTSRTADGRAEQRESTAYNWENNASNAGSDYLFQNDGYLSASNTPASHHGRRRYPRRTDRANRRRSIVDYVSADKNGGGDVRNSNCLSTRFRQNVPRGSAFRTRRTRLTASSTKTRWSTGSRPLVECRVLFSLDNEPDLGLPHAEVHPNPVTYGALGSQQNGTPRR